MSVVLPHTTHAPPGLCGSSGETVRAAIEARLGREERKREGALDEEEQGSERKALGSPATNTTAIPTQLIQSAEEQSRGAEQQRRGGEREGQSCQAFPLRSPTMVEC